MKHKRRRKGKAMLTGFITLLLCFLLYFIFLLWRSPGKIRPYTDKNGEILSASISEKTRVEINGCRQGLFLKGENIENPVLLFIHGGPGFPEYFLAEKFPTGMESRFTVCYWEQRGAGLSYDPDMPPEDITVSQLIDDITKVSEYLATRFGQEKIYLMGHSWGSFLGIQAAQKNPDLFYAYIGISQISNTAESEAIAYRYMLDQYTVKKNAAKVKAFEKYDIRKDSSPEKLREYIESPLRDTAMHELGIGSMHEMRSLLSGIFLPVMHCTAYTLEEKINIWRGKAFLANSTDLRAELLSADLPQSITSLDIPIYFFGGRYDYTVNYGLQKAYFETIDAPIKGFYTFESSAHSPLFEEQELFMKILTTDVLQAEAGLSDFAITE